MPTSALISFATWRRVVLGAGVGAVFGLVLIAFLALTGTMSLSVSALPPVSIAQEALVRACEQLVPWLLLWLVLLPALLRIPFGQPWLALLIYVAAAVLLIPRALDIADVSSSQLVAIALVALVTGLPVVRAADVWLSASFVAALHLVTVSLAGLPFGSTAGAGVMDARLAGDVLLTGGRMGPVFGIFGMLGCLWVAGALLQHQHRVFASAASLARSRRDAFADFGFGLAVAAASVSIVFMLMLLTQQSRIAGLEPSMAAISASLHTGLPVAIAGQWLFAYVLVSVLMLTLRRGWLAVALGSAVAVGLHLTSPGTTAWTAVSVAAMSVATGTAFISTGRLWMPVALAYGWLLFEGPIFGFASGGLPVRLSWFQQETLQYTVWSGGVHGPDASLFGIAARVIMAGAVIAFARKES